ncbi:hypothetical protein GBAR_LOCUS10739, partial [Geodia barretti]
KQKRDQQCDTGNRHKSSERDAQKRKQKVSKKSEIQSSSICGEDETVSYRGKAGKSQTEKEMHSKEADRQKRKATTERAHVAEEQYSQEERHTHKVRNKQELDSDEEVSESSTN